MPILFLNILADSARLLSSLLALPFPWAHIAPNCANSTSYSTFLYRWFLAILTYAMALL